MVVFKTGATPPILNAFLTAPQPLEVLDQIHAQFAVGSFARFHSSVELFIRDRPEFYSLSHLQIRQLLDEEDFLDPFLIIEARTEDSDAVWYIDTTKAGAFAENGGVVDGQLIKHGDEPALLRIRTKITDVGVLEANLSIGNTDILETLDKWPYDPKDDQEPYTLGEDFEHDDSWFPAAYITATKGEVETSNDMELRKRFLGPGKGHPSLVIRLKPEVARREGLKSNWTIGGDEPDENGKWSLQAKYDPQSEKWRGYVPLQH
jgi:hypothetical protein